MPVCKSPVTICAFLSKKNIPTGICDPSNSDKGAFLIRIEIAVQNYLPYVISDFQLFVDLSRFYNYNFATIPFAGTIDIYTSIPNQFAECCTDFPSCYSETDITNVTFDGIAQKNILGSPIELAPGTSLFVLLLRECILVDYRICEVPIWIDGNYFQKTKNRGCRPHEKCELCPIEISKCCDVEGDSLPHQDTLQTSFLYFEDPSLYRVFFVTPSGGGISGDSFSDALTLPQALLLAQDNDEIWMRQGTYVVGGTIFVDKKIRLYGGFASDSDILLCQRDSSFSNNTILVDNISLNNSHIVLDAVTMQNQVNIVSSVSGIVLRNNVMQKLDIGSQSLVVVFQCTFSNITDTSVVTAQSFSEVMFDHCEFRNNSSTATQGGAILIQDSARAKVRNSLFVGNQSISDGGAVAAVNNAVFQSINCTFSQNACGAGSNGEAVACFSGAQISMENSILYTNSMHVGAGSIAKIQHSLVGSLSPPDITGPGTVQFGGGVIVGNPLFISGIDFHLQSSSPCIGTGNIFLLESGFTAHFDLDRRKRVKNSLVDMGPYEL